MTYASFGLFVGWVLTHMIAFVALILWAIVWKGLALWRAGRNNQPVWFVALLLVNSIGVLEILYLLFFAKKRS